MRRESIECIAPHQNQLNTKGNKEDKPNYRLWCLRWLKRQSHWSGWGWNQVSCPCSWQQGLWDLRFQPINIGDTSFLSPVVPHYPSQACPPSLWPCLTRLFQGTLSSSPEAPPSALIVCRHFDDGHSGCLSSFDWHFSNN